MKKVGVLLSVIFVLAGNCQKTKGAEFVEICKNLSYYGASTLVNSTISIDGVAQTVTTTLSGLCKLGAGGIDILSAPVFMMNSATDPNVIAQTVGLYIGVLQNVVMAGFTIAAYKLASRTFNQDKAEGAIEKSRYFELKEATNVNNREIKQLRERLDASEVGFKNSNDIIDKTKENNSI